jgi:hypothetical protein
MEPKVLKNMLVHFMYTNTLAPMEKEQQGAVAMTQDLLAAAHQYKLEMLEFLRCCVSTSELDMVAGTMAVAGQRSCGAPMRR